LGEGGACPASPSSEANLQYPGIPVFPLLTIPSSLGVFDLRNTAEVNKGTDQEYGRYPGMAVLSLKGGPVPEHLLYVAS